jgi:hypothetical protein
MTLNDEERRFDLSADSKDIKRFLAEIKKKQWNISKLSGSYTKDVSTGESGLEVSFTCRTEGGDIDVMYIEGLPSCASIDEAEEMRIRKKMTVRVPQAVFDEGKHQDIVDIAKKWFGVVGINMELVITNKMDL